MRDITLADTFYHCFTTRSFSTGAPTQLAGTPVVSAYENDSLTQITAGITLGVDHDGVTGLNLLTVVATGANGYESGKDYNLVITTGTVGGVSVVGEVVGQFSIGRSAAAVDLANGTDGLGAIKTTADAIETDTQDIQGRLPAALVGGRMDSEVGTVNGTAQTAGDIMGSLGEENASAAAGDPSTTESVMQYVKQLVNILAGTAGIATFPAEAAPANAVSLAEVIRAIHADVTGLNGDAMRGTDGANTTTPPTANAIADQVWDEAKSGHVGAGSFGEEVQAHALSSEISALNDPTAASIADAVLDEALSGHAVAGSLGKAITDIEADTNELQSDDVPGLIAALNDLAASDILTTALTEAYAADGATMTLSEALYMIWSALSEFAISGTTITAKKLDGATTAMTFTLDDGTNPTSRTRAT